MSMKKQDRSHAARCVRAHGGAFSPLTRRALRRKEAATSLARARGGPPAGVDAGRGPPGGDRKQPVTHRSIMTTMPGCSSEGPSAIECRQIADLLGDYLDGSLPKETRELIDFHIDGCAPCVAFVNTYRGTMNATRRLVDVPIPSELKKRLLAVVKSTSPPQSRS